MPESVVAKPMLAKFLSAMVGAAGGYGRAGYVMNGPYAPSRPGPSSYLAPRWHPDRLMLPPLTLEEREIFRELTTG